MASNNTNGQSRQQNLSGAGNAAGNAAGDSGNGAGKAAKSGAGGSSAAPAWLGKRVGRFKLVGFLGQGAMGRVFRVEDSILQRYAALKVLPRTVKQGGSTVAVERLLREARAAATLEHPNVVTVYEVNESAGVHYIAMELVEGGTLHDLVKAAGPLEYTRACMLCADAAEALHQAHQRGIVHRDVKPSNLMLTRAGRCKVTDFGLARLARVLRLHTIPVESASPALSAPLTPGARATPRVPFASIFSRHPRLWATAAAAAVVLAGAIAIALLNRGKPADAKADGAGGAGNELAAAQPAGTSSTPAAVAPAAALADAGDARPVAAAQSARTAGAVIRPQPAPAEARPQPIDLLHHLDLSRASVKGNWRFEAGDLVSDSSGPAILEFPQAVPQEYDFRIEFTPEDCAEQLLFKPDPNASKSARPGNSEVHGTAFNWCMNVGEICGLESLNHLHVFDPASPVTRKWHVSPGERHQSLVRVRNAGVKILLDGQPFLDWPTDYHDLSRVDDWSMRTNTKLGLGSWNKPTRFHKVELIVPPGRS